MIKFLFEVSTAWVRKVFRGSRKNMPMIQSVVYKASITILLVMLFVVILFSAVNITKYYYKYKTLRNEHTCSEPMHPVGDVAEPKEYDQCSIYLHEKPMLSGDAVIDSTFYIEESGDLVSFLPVSNRPRPTLACLECHEDKTIKGSPHPRPSV